MKSVKSVCLVIASNIVSVVLTTLAVIYAWKNISSSSSSSSIELSTSSGHRAAQQCCSCTGPTLAPFNIVSSSSFDCPSGEESIDFSTTGAVAFSNSNSNRLCTLVLISPDGTNLKPVGRSYDGYAWEASAGEFSRLAWSCSGSSCVANLPDLPAGSVYQLTSFDAPQQFQGSIDKIARFLEQTTFGPTRAALKSFDTTNLPNAFANWVRDQQTTVPVSSHRAFFRRHLNARMEFATPQGAVTHPCQAGTRYRRFAFSAKDDQKYLDITTVGTKKILSVDGFVRTVVEGSITSIWDTTVVYQDGR
jgi:hypothetical protein